MPDGIRKCRHCKRPYWRYRPDHPPPFFCSVRCRDEHRAGIAHGERPARAPWVVLAEFRQHRLAAHGSSSVLEWYDCEACERLEAEYADALAELGDSACLTATCAIGF